MINKYKLIFVAALSLFAVAVLVAVVQLSTSRYLTCIDPAPAAGPMGRSTAICLVTTMADTAVPIIDQDIVVATAAITAPVDRMPPDIDVVDKSPNGKAKGDE
jgi:hypothetical protein